MIFTIRCASLIHWEERRPLTHCQLYIYIYISRENTIGTLSFVAYSILERQKRPHKGCRQHNDSLGYLETKLALVFELLWVICQTRMARCITWGNGQGTLNWFVYWDTYACNLATLRLGGILLWGFFFPFVSNGGFGVLFCFKFCCEMPASFMISTYIITSFLLSLVYRRERVFVMGII